MQSVIEAAAHAALPRSAARASDLFEAQAEESLALHHVSHDLVASALATIESLLRRNKVPCVSWSTGKDSSVVLNLTICAAINVLRSDGHCPPIHVLSADTGVESPVVHALAKTEAARVREFAKRHGIEVELHVARPTLSASWAVRNIGGRALPTFPNSKRDCTTDYKILPLQRVRKAIIASVGAERVVTFIGTRSSESMQRATSTSERRETAHTTWFGPDGDERLSPILHWDTDDVWSYLGECAAGQHPTYSNFAELMEFYAAAGASSCVVVADMRSAAASKPCGARSGCAVCVAVQRDRSVENMIDEDPERYGFLAPLLRLRDWIANTQWDWSLRNYVGRTIDDEGFITIRADQYSPDTCLNLLRYALFAQDEANRLGAPSHVELVGARELLAIDWYWSCRAMHPPYTALKVYLQHVAGHRVQAPEVEVPLRPSPVPTLGKVHVGQDWDQEGHPLRPDGLRHPIWESFNESCGPQVRTGSKGQCFLELPEDVEFDVDEEGADLFLHFEASRKIADYAAAPNADWTSSAMDYLVYGCVTLAKGQSSAVDNMLRRAQWLQRHNLHGQRSVDELRTRYGHLAVQQAALF